RRRLEHLHRGGAAEERVLGLVDPGEAAFAEELEDTVSFDLATDHGVADTARAARRRAVLARREPLLERCDLGVEVLRRELRASQATEDVDRLLELPLGRERVAPAQEARRRLLVDRGGIERLRVGLRRLARASSRRVDVAEQGRGARAQRVLRADRREDA